MQAAAERTSWYGDPESLDLRAALAVRHGCSEDNLVVGSGIDDLMSLLVRTFCAPADIAVATRGTYPTWGYHVAGHGARLVTAEPAPCAAIDVDALIACAAAAAPKVVYVANPDNPSGAFVSASELARLRAGLADDVLLVIDEAYADFVAADLLPPAVLDPRTIRLRTFSKAYGLAGARVGYAIAAQAVIATFKKIRQHFGVNRTAQIGALAALGDPAYRRPNHRRSCARPRRVRRAWAAARVPNVALGDQFRLLRDRHAQHGGSDGGRLARVRRVRAQTVGTADRRFHSGHGRNRRPNAAAFAQIFSEALACAREKAAV